MWWSKKIVRLTFSTLQQLWCYRSSSNLNFSCKKPDAYPEALFECRTCLTQQHGYSNSHSQSRHCFFLQWMTLAELSEREGTNPAVQREVSRSQSDCDQPNPILSPELHPMWKFPSSPLQAFQSQKTSCYDCRSPDRNLAGRKRRHGLQARPCSWVGFHHYPCFHGEA